MASLTIANNTINQGGSITFSLSGFYGGYAIYVGVVGGGYATFYAPTGNLSNAVIGPLSEPPGSYTLRAWQEDEYGSLIVEATAPFTVVAAVTGWDFLAVKSGTISPYAPLVWDFLAVKSGAITPYIPLVWDFLAVKSGAITPYVPFTGWDFLAVKSGSLSPYVEPPPTGDATIIVHSTPSAATVKIKGAVVGTTPISYKIAAGTYTLLVQLEGYKDYSTQVTVAALQTKTINVTLEKVAPPPGKTNWPLIGGIAAAGAGAVAIGVAASKKKKTLAGVRK